MRFVVLQLEKLYKIIKLKKKIEMLKNQFSLQICGDHPNVFWERKKHVVSLPYEKEFFEDNILTKARPCQMNSEYLDLCKKEIDTLLQKGLIRPSKSPRSCTAFYVNKKQNKKGGYPD